MLFPILLCGQIRKDFRTGVWFIKLYCQLEVLRSQVSLTVADSFQQYFIYVIPTDTPFLLIAFLLCLLSPEEVGDQLPDTWQGILLVVLTYFLPSMYENPESSTFSSQQNLYLVERLSNKYSLKNIFLIPIEKSIL